MAALFRAAVLLALAAFGAVVSAGAAPLGMDAGGLRGQDSAVQEARYSYCEWMRRGCMYRESWGEVGESSCRRYHTDCTGGSSYCERLRQGCEYKHAWDETGQGNCRRYRANCGGGDSYSYSGHGHRYGHSYGYGYSNGMSHCQRLRYSCTHGEGNCRRYVRECTSQ